MVKSEEGIKSPAEEFVKQLGEHPKPNFITNLAKKLALGFVAAMAVTGAGYCISLGKKALEQEPSKNLNQTEATIKVPKNSHEYDIYFGDSLSNSYSVRWTSERKPGDNYLKVVDGDGGYLFTEIDNFENINYILKNSERNDLKNNKIKYFYTPDHIGGLLTSIPKIKSDSESPYYATDGDIERTLTLISKGGGLDEIIKASNEEK